jgi:hypothetical protein
MAMGTRFRRLSAVVVGGLLGVGSLAVGAPAHADPSYDCKPVAPQEYFCSALFQESPFAPQPNWFIEADAFGYPVNTQLIFASNEQSAQSGNAAGVVVAGAIPVITKGAGTDGSPGVLEVYSTQISWDPTTNRCTVEVSVIAPEVPCPAGSIPQPPYVPPPGS